MREPEPIGEIMHRACPLLQQKILQNEIFNRWQEIFPKLAKKVFPVKVKGEILYVYTTDSSFKNMIKFNARNFISTINETLSPGKIIISKILFSANSEPEIKLAVPKKKLPQKNLDTLKVELTPEEIAECEQKAAVVTDEKQRQILLDLLLSHARAQKRKFSAGWHKCKLCNLLCPPKEIFCDICIVKEREKMKKAIRQMFLDAPEIPFFQVQQKITEQFPDFSKECTFEKIDFVRMELIAQKAAKVPYNDKTSADAIFLVRLIQQLPEKKITPQIIETTLREFRFNLANLPEYFNKLEKEKF